MFTYKATETLNLSSISPKCQVKVEIKNAILKNLTINITDYKAGAKIQKVTVSERIAIINNNLKSQKALWCAGETSLSKMSYEDKKSIFGGKVPDLQGFEFYKKGVFEFKSEQSSPAPKNSNFVDYFDWRNRHGKNWLTPVKHQNTCGSCVIFTSLGAIEAVANLYFNQNINFDLSEQQLVSCNNNEGSCKYGWATYTILNYCKTTGVVEEACFPYQNSDTISCNNICNNNLERVFIKDFSYFDHYKEDSIKKTIIKYGPVTAAISSWGHAMTLLGFGTIKAGDRIDFDLSGTITISEDDPRIGETYWIFRNSYGTECGDNGYGYIKVAPEELYLTYKLHTPITSMNYDETDIVCDDRDGDGYYWWGIGTKPVTCPDCPNEPDGDDSNPDLGPMDEFGNCKLNKINLLIRDDIDDKGKEPSNVSNVWSSPDIWLTDHDFRKIQPYDLHKYSSCYIAVRVKNIGTEKSKGTEKLHVHWSRSSLRSRWRVSWFESLHLLADLMGAPKGAEVTPAVGINIPSLQPNEEVTLYVLWNLPSQLINPKSVSLSWGFALLAGLDDGLEISGKNEDFLFTENFAKGSNNIAIGNGSLYIIGKGYKQVSELGYMDKPFVVGFDQIAVASHYRLGDFAEVYALLSPDLMRNLNKDKSKGIAVIDESSVLLQSPEAELHFNAFDDKEGLYYVGAKVHFISDKMPDRNEFNFDLTLKTESDPKETLRFTAIRDESVFFKADADVDKKKVVKAREEVSLSSNTIADNAEYVWFDGKGTKIGEGSQISTTPDRSQKYKVSITKEDDGYRSYDEVEVIAVDGVINSISPNPARDNAVVSYKLSDNAFGVSLHISNIQNTLSVAYSLDTNATEKDISLSGFSAGTYIVKLVVGGTVVDSQNLIVY